LYIFFYINS